MEHNMKMGVLFVTSGWFRSIGLQSEESSFTTEVKRIGAEIITKFREFIDPVYTGVLFSEENAKQAAQEIKKADVAGLIVAPLMWCEDQIPRTALKELPGLPVILCTFFPTNTLPDYLPYAEMLKGSGSVGTLQLSGFFKREGIKYQAVSGYYNDPAMYETIKDYCIALKVKQQLRFATCGVLPFPCDQMSTTYVDEFNIRKLYGIEYKYIEISRLYQAAQESSSDEIEELKKVITTEGYEVEIDDRNLKEGIKYALAMEKIVRNEDLNILCMNDVIDEMHSAIGLRPSLYNPHLSEKGLVVSMEADIAAGIGMYILKNFTGQTPFYVEILNIDLQKNAIVLGHAGYHEVINYDEKCPVKIVRDVEYKNSDEFSGAVTCFKYKPGDVTLVNCVYNGEKLRLSAIEGESIDCPPILEDTCHLFCKLNPPVSEFLDAVLDSGISQHFLVIPGKYCKSLERLRRFIDMEYKNYNAM
jgi:L-arabinose isomerase